MNYRWKWDIFFQPSPEGHGTYFDMLIQGLGWTVATALAAWILALVLGVIVGVMRTLPSKAAERFGYAYVELFRNIPLLVQIFLWYFVLPELVPADWGTWIKQLPNSPFWTTFIAVGFYMSSRVAEQVRAGIGSLPRGQIMAARAIGLNLPQCYRFVLLPIAGRIMLPSLTSDFLNTIKNTSIGLTIGLMELTSRARAVQEFTFQVFEAFTVATAIYLLLNMVVVFAMRWLEHKVAIPGYVAGGR